MDKNSKQLKGRCFVNPIMNGFVMNNVLMNDCFDLLCGDVGVPDPIRPDHENRSLVADSQAVNLASENNSLWTVAVLKPKFLDESFEFIPRRQARIRIAAFGFRGSGAKQQMVADPLNAHAASAANGTRVVPRFTCSRTAMRAH